MYSPWTYKEGKREVGKEEARKNKEKIHTCIIIKQILNYLFIARGEKN
jgi:hypothetical protein